MDEVKLKALIWEFLGCSGKTAVRLNGDNGAHIFSDMIVVDLPPEKLRDKRIVIELEADRQESNSEEERVTRISKTEHDTQVDWRDGLD